MVEVLRILYRTTVKMVSASDLSWYFLIPSASFSQPVHALTGSSEMSIMADASCKGYLYVNVKKPKIYSIKSTLSKHKGCQFSDVPAALGFGDPKHPRRNGSPLQ